MNFFKSICSNVSSFMLIFSLAGCYKSMPSFEQRITDAKTLAHSKNWQREGIKTDGQFDLVSFHPTELSEDNTLVVFIEGDGLAWVGRSRVSSNPTPTDPVALRLAVAQSDRDVVYLARPCQFIDLKSQKNCQKKYWTSHRFAPEIVDSMNKAISKIKDKYKKTQVILVGYSGGGAIAALIGSQRQDVQKLITVAGNMDPAAWAKHHKVSLLEGSLNPVDFVDKLKSIPQIHYVGGQDNVVPLKIVESYVKAFPKNSQPKIVIVPDAHHSCCWGDLQI